MKEAAGLWKEGDYAASYQVIKEGINNLQSKSKPPVHGVGVDREIGKSPGRSWTRADIAKMPDEEYIKSLPLIEAAIRDGRVK